MDASPETQAGSQKHVLRLALRVLLPVVLIGLFLPTLLGKTSLRDVVLNLLVDSNKLSLQSSDASLGYFSHTTVSGLKIQTTSQRATVSFDKIAADRSWLSMLLSRPNLGNFRFDKPYVDLKLDGKAVAQHPDQPHPNTASPSPLLPNLTAEIVDAHVVVRTVTDEPPPIDISGFNAKVRLERRGQFSILIAEPGLAFDHQPLTPQLCGQGLQLIAPLLADEVSASGEFSLNLTKFEVPVGSSSPNADGKALATQISGQLELHSATVAMKNTLASSALNTVMKIAGIEFPNTLTVAENVSVEFAVVDGRVHHSGLALVLPHGDRSIKIVSSGSVGLDETLDLNVSIKLPQGLLGNGTVRDALTSQPIQLIVTGTLESPKLRVSADQGLLKSVGSLLETTGSDSTETKPGELGGALTDIIGDVWDLAKERQKNKEQNRQSPTETKPLFPSEGRTPLLPRFREPSRPRGIFPRRGRSNQNNAPGDSTPPKQNAVPQPPAPASPSGKTPTPI